MRSEIRGAVVFQRLYLCVSVVGAVDAMRTAIISHQISSCFSCVATSVYLFDCFPLVMLLQCLICFPTNLQLVLRHEELTGSPIYYH